MSQPKPKKNKNKPVYKTLIKEINERAKLGKSRYGVYLQPENGRDALVDLKEELLDGILYLLQYIEEDKIRERKRKRK